MSENSTPLRKTKERPVSQKQAMLLDRFDKFLEKELGCYPASIASIKLRMTSQGVFQASERGWIKYFSIGRNRLYSRRDVVSYRWNISRKYRDTGHFPLGSARDLSLE
jgi:hypothetical protein